MRSNENKTEIEVENTQILVGQVNRMVCGSDEGIFSRHC